MPKIVERKADTGATEYGVQYDDGHIKWCDSLPHANLTHYKATTSKAKKRENHKKVYGR